MRRRLSFLRIAGLVLAALAWAGCAAPRPAVLPASRAYLRSAETTNRVVSLEVAVRTFARGDGKGPPVRLVGVTHLGDAAYFRGLQALLDAQPLVLFEGVGAKDKHRIASEDGTYSLQPALARALGLRFQLDAIDYRGTNFVNSDLSIADLQRILESGAAGDAGQLGDLISVMDGSSFLGGLVRIGLSVIETSPPLRATVRLAMIETLGAVEVDLGDTAALPAEIRRLMEVLITERNKAVLSDVRRAAASWKAPRGRPAQAGAAAAAPGIAVFYGAGHMPDLERRLGSELGYRPVAEEWRTAFAVDLKTAGLSDAEVRLARSLVRAQLQALRGK